MQFCLLSIISFLFYIREAKMVKFIDEGFEVLKILFGTFCNSN